METVVLNVNELDIDVMNYLISKGFKEDQEVEVTSYMNPGGQVISIVLPV